MRISDWSSDVCSSDLDAALVAIVADEGRRQALIVRRPVTARVVAALRILDLHHVGAEIGQRHGAEGTRDDAREIGDADAVARREGGSREIGRASGRERVWQYV